MTVTIWHNPRCSKSRQTLTLLQETGVSVDIIDYQKTPPTLADITRVLDLLDIPAVQLMRTGEKVFKDMGLTRTNPNAALIQAMVNHPVLIERPVVLANGKAALGRPPESVLAIL